MAPEIQGYIRQKLAAVEAEHKVRILLAIESGSRAWGFPSEDSDYDVRFIYVRRQGDYLSIKSFRDVIETPLVQDDFLGVPIDLNGWDLRKALALSLKSNAVFLEWLISPIQYMADAGVIAELLEFAQTQATITVIHYHYASLAKSAWDQIEAAGDQVKLKLYCYAIRPALAIEWIAQHITVPPMDIHSLCEGMSLTPKFYSALAQLVEVKFTAQEKDKVARNAVLDAFIAGGLQTVLPRPSITKENDEKEQLADCLFRKIVTRA